MPAGKEGVEKRAPRNQPEGLREQMRPKAGRQTQGSKAPQLSLGRVPKGSRRRGSRLADARAASQEMRPDAPRACAQVRRALRRSCSPMPAGLGRPGLLQPALEAPHPPPQSTGPAPGAGSRERLASRARGPQGGAARSPKPAPAFARFPARFPWEKHGREQRGGARLRARRRGKCKPPCKPPWALPDSLQSPSSLAPSVEMTSTHCFGASRPTALFFPLCGVHSS